MCSVTDFFHARALFFYFLGFILTPSDHLREVINVSPEAEFPSAARNECGLNAV